LRKIVDDDPDDLRMCPTGIERTDLTFSADSIYLATGAVGGLVRQWEVVTGRKATALPDTLPVGTFR